MKGFQILVLLSSIAPTASYPGFASEIPNGGSVPNPNAEGETWAGVGHINPAGGGDRNPFGLDFKANGLVWTKDLCETDSDGDGATNGEELGDPECIWQKGDEPFGPALSHPGVADVEVQEEMPLPLDEVTTEVPPGEGVTTEAPPGEELAEGGGGLTTTTEMPPGETLTTEAPLEEDLDNETMVDDWANETEAVDEEPLPDESTGNEVGADAAQSEGSSSNYSFISMKVISVVLLFPAVFAHFF